jgi:hypothetical protein
MKLDTFMLIVSMLQGNTLCMVYISHSLLSPFSSVTFLTRRGCPGTFTNATTQTEAVPAISAVPHVTDKET